MKPAFFRTAADLRRWFERHHASEKELLVGYYKKGSGKPSVTWPESVDEALCVGWIDGIRRSVDEESYTIRFSPRAMEHSAAGRRVPQLTRPEPRGRRRTPRRAAR